MIAFPAPLVVFLVVGASAVSVYGTHYYMESEQNKILLEQQEAYDKALADKDVILDEYKTELTTLRERKPRVVRVCKAPVPASSSGVQPPSAGVAEEEDLGPVLRACLEELIRADKHREWYRNPK